MFVCYKKEIVYFGLEDNDFDNDINLFEIIGVYLFLKEFKEVFFDEDIVVFDICNDYEYDLGYFCGVICLDICNFCELL